MTKQIPSGYKQTKVGIIPEDWEVVKLGTVLDYEQPNKYLVNNEEYADTNRLPVLTAGKTFILGYTNETNGIYDKLPVIIFDDFTTSNHYVDFNFKIKSSAIKLLTSQYNLKYLYEQMQLIKFCLGSEHKRYWISEYSQINIPLPPIKEQEKIAEILSTWDNAITKQEELIKQKQIFKKGIMQQIFSQKIRFKDDNGNDYPAWQSKKLGDICKIAKSGGTPLSTYKEYYDGDIPFLAISDITTQGKYLTYTSKKISQKGLDNSSSWIVPENTIIYTMYASVGFVSINKVPLATSQAVINLILKTGINTEFIYYYLLDYKQYIHKYIETGTQGNLNAEIVKSLKINSPSLIEQNKIADFLSNIDDEITKQTQVLEQLKLQKQSLMQKLLTGQVRVIL